MMLETPAAAIQVKEFCREVDFVSIGTNDLVQYHAGGGSGERAGLSVLRPRRTRLS